MLEASDTDTEDPRQGLNGFPDLGAPETSDSPSMISLKKHTWLHLCISDEFLGFYPYAGSPLGLTPPTQTTSTQSSSQQEHK